MKDFEVTMNEYLPLRDVVFYTLRRAILKGELEPGERLMEVALANKMGVSRTPIREAIRKLELEGLVVMIPRRGAEVAKITEKDLSDVLEVRECLEDLAIRLACERITDEEIAHLKETAKLFAASLNGPDLSQSASYDADFHDIIFGATHNARLIQILNNLREQMYRYRLEYIKDKKFHAQLISEHDEIVQALEACDPERSVEIMGRHIRYQEQAVLNTIRNQ